MAFRARKGFGTFEKRAPGLEIRITYAVGNFFVFQNVPVRCTPIGEDLVHQHPETIYVRGS